MRAPQHDICQEKLTEHLHCQLELLKVGESASRLLCLLQCHTAKCPTIFLRFRSQSRIYIVFHYLWGNVKQLQLRNHSSENGPKYLIRTVKEYHFVVVVLVLRLWDGIFDFPRGAKSSLQRKYDLNQSSALFWYLVTPDPDYISFKFRTNMDFLYHLNFCSEGFKAQTEKSEFLRFAVVSLESHGKMKIKSHNLKTDTTELLYTKRHLLTVPMRYFRSILVH